MISARFEKHLSDKTTQSSFVAEEHTTFMKILYKIQKYTYYVCLCIYNLRHTYKYKFKK